MDFYDYESDPTYQAQLEREWKAMVKAKRRQMTVKRRVCLWIHERLERACSRHVGRYWITKGAVVDPWWFKWASRAEFALRRRIEAKKGGGH